ncbi:MAG TPA: hypothetical protein DIW52_28130 [Pseudomonas sp.]|nr:hypothetical protein [Pseudomonas sp.]
MRPGFPQQHRTLVGAGLLANAVCQSASSVTDTPHSRASPLPQGIVHSHRSPITSIAGVVTDNPLESPPRLKETTSC